MRTKSCRFCATTLRQTFVDLGMSPLSNAYIDPAKSAQMEPFYPLHAFVCESCFLVQLEEFESPAAIFSDYAYFSSYSTTWLEHARAYVDDVTLRFGLSAQSHVVEIASNDGYLLQYFVKKGIPVLGIEPAANVAKVAVDAGVPTIIEFFGRACARSLVAQGKKADVLLGNNVLAHVPDINDFVAGLALTLKPEGVITMEFPHLLRLMAGGQFDTVYHEHFSYLSFATVRTIFAAHGLRMFDVAELPTHGGSLRIFAAHADSGHVELPAVAALLRREEEHGLGRLETYARFSEATRAVKRGLLEFLIAAKRAGKTIAGYGAPAKGTTLLNYCGIGTDFIEYTVDRSPHKQGKMLPGVRIPILAPEHIFATKPDYVVLLPWNLKDEIMEQMAGIREWGGRFVVPLPAPEVCA